MSKKSEEEAASKIWFFFFSFLNRCALKRCCFFKMSAIKPYKEVYLPNEWRECHGPNA